MTKHLTSDERRGALLSLLSVVFFAANILLLKALIVYVEAVDGWVGTLVRGAVGLVILALLYRGGRRLQWLPLIKDPVLLVRGVVGATTIAILYLTVDHLGAGRALILNLTYPLFAAVLAAVFLRERLSWRGVICLVAGFGGLVVFFSGSTQLGGFGAWDALALFGAFLAGVVVLLIRHLRHSFHPSTVYASQCLFSTLVAIPMCVGPAQQVTPLAWAFLAVAAALVAAGQLLLTHAFRVISVAKGSGIQMLLPPLTAAGGMLFFGESYSALETVGAVVTLGATWLLITARTPVSRDSAVHRTTPVVKQDTPGTL